MRRKFLLKVMILSLLFVAMGGGDLFAQSVTEVSDAEGLKSALTKNGTVKLTGDIEVETTIGVPYVTVTLDLNGHSIKAKSDDIYPINNDGILTITDSKGNGVIEGLGLSSGFDNNTNAKGPRSAGAELFINGGTFRNLNSETGAAVYVHQGEATINGGSFYGRNIAIMSANGTVEINGGFIDGYESAIVSSASVKIKGATKISGQCRTENGGSIFIAPDVTVTYYQARIGNANNWTSYETLAEAITAAQAGDEVYVFAGTYAVPSVKAGITINGEVDEDGKTKVLLEGTLTGTLEDLTLKNLHIKGGNAQRWGYAEGDLYFDNVTFEATSVYAIHFDGIAEDANLYYKDCTIIGWAAMGGSPASCKFEGCTIKDNGTYGVIRTYFNATIEGCTFDVRNANPNDVYQDGIHAVSGADVVVTGCTNVNGDMKDIVNVSGSSTVNVDGVVVQNPVRVGDEYYATIQEAIVAAAPSGIVELVTDVTVDKWIMFSERLSIGNGNIITKEINGLTIDGNNHKLTINSIESAGNGNRLFYDATNLNIQDLTIECVDAAANQGGIGLTSGTISNVNFIGGGPAILPGTGEITVTGCTFKTNGTSIYYEEARDNLVVEGNTFENPDGVNVILLRGNTEFTNNIINSGRTVNVVSGSPVVSGNDFKDVRFKVYNAAEATISNNTINNLEFNDESVVYSTFTENTLSDAAQAVLDAMIVAKIGEVKYCSLQKAIDAAVDGNTITLIKDVTEDVTITQKADLDLIINGDGNKFTGVMTVFGDGRQNGAETLKIQNINFIAKNGATSCIVSPDRTAQNPAKYSYSHNVTVDNCTFTDLDGTVNCAAIRHEDGGDKNLTVTNCTVDATMHSLLQVNNVEGKLTLTGCTVQSKNGVNLNSCTNVEMTGCNFDVKGYALRSGVSSGGNPNEDKTFVINNNTLKSACNDGDAVIMFRTSSVNADFSMTENVVSGTTHISGNTAATKISADANYWGEGLTGPVVAEGSAPVVVNSYYTDEALTNLMRIPMGDNFTAYTREDAIWGEVGGNAVESFVIKVLDADGIVMGTTTLNNVGGIIDGSVYVTWSLKLNAASNIDEYWTMEWTTAPSINKMPAKVELWVDGVKVSGGDVVLNAPDNLSKINAANIDVNGNILAYRQTLPDAVANGDNVAILAPGTYDVPTGKDLTITGAVAGVVFDNIGAKNMGGANVTFNKVTFDYYPNVNYTGLQHSGNLVYNNCTFEGQPFLYGTSETFNSCTFNQNSSDAYNVWTYGAKEVAFNECIFNSAGKSVLIYSEDKNLFNNVAVTKCTFNASAPVEGKAAIEMDSSLTAGINLTIDSEETPDEDRTTATGFGSGNVSGNSLWNNKKGASGVNNDITVTVAGVVVLQPEFEAQIGETKYEFLSEAIAAVGDGDVVIQLLKDAILDYNAREAYGTAETTSLTINGDGDGKTLTLNQTNSDWSSFGLKNAGAKVVFNNMTIEKTGYGDTSGAWNTHAIIFSSNVEMTDVTVNNSMAVQDGATLNNVTINEANGYYGLWINGNGQSVTMNGGSINATNGGRGIKVADQYIDAPASVTLNVTGTTFNTAEKAAVLVSSTAGAKVTAEGCDITNVAADNTNFVWVDEDWAAYYDNVKVYDEATKTQENEESFPIKVYKTDINGTVRAYFKNLDELFAAKSTQIPLSDNYIELRGDVVANSKVNVSYSNNYYYNFGTSVENGVTMTFNYADDWNMLPHFGLGENITMNVPYLQVIGGDISIAGTLNTGYLYLYGTGEGVVIEETGVVNANVSNDKTVQVKGGTVLTVKGELNTTTLNVWTGDANNSELIVSGDNAEVNAATIHAWNGKDGVSSQKITVEDGAKLTATSLQADRGSVINLNNATIVAPITLGYGDNVGTLVESGNSTVEGNININSTTSTVTSDGGLENSVSTNKEGYMVVLEDGVYRIAQIVAKIGTTDYASLQDAINAAKSGDVIELCTIASMNENVTAQIPAGVTIKSNGFSIDGSIRMLGDLTLDGPLTITGGLWVGKTEGTLAATLAGDKLTANYFMFQRGSYNINADIDAVYGYLSYEATFEVNSTITTTNTNGEPLWINGNVNLNNEANLTAKNIWLSNENTVLNVKEGASVIVSVKVNVANSGAELYSTGNISGLIDNSSNGTIVISGGVYTNPIQQDWCADGFIPKDNGDGTYGVVEGLAGDGTATEPYIINSLIDLKYFRDAVNAGDTYAGKTVVLAADIDLAEGQNRGAEESNWTPIGNSTEKFQGTFDGQNHTISNLKIYDVELEYAGFFGYTTNATIKNVKVHNVDINAYSHVGAIAGIVYTGNVDNCHVSGTINLVSQYAYAAGITGYGYVTVKNSSVIAEGTGIIKVVEKTGAGGITGWRGEGNTGIYNCTVKNLNITAWSNVGGITGFLHYENTIDNCVVDNVNLYKTREDGQASIGLAAGGWAEKANNAPYTITVKNTTFNNMSINGTAINSFKQNGERLIGSNYSSYINIPAENLVVEENEFGETITDNLSIVVKSETHLGYALASDENEVVNIGDNIVLAASLNIIGNRIIDLNGFTISGTDNSTSSFGLINIQPNAELTINDSSDPSTGKITLTATNNREWNAYSSVISNQRGKLTVNGGTIEHLGGTDMAYAIDNLTNTGNQIAKTIVNGGIIKSTYRAIRQFLNSSAEGVNNILTINGGTIDGANKSIWMQDSNANANPGTLTVGENAQLKGDVYLSVTEGSTSWPVEVSIAAAALQGESTVMTNGNVPAGYEVKEMNGLYGVYHGVAKIDNVLYESLAEAATAAQNGETIELLWQEGQAPIAMNASLYGKNVTITGKANVDWSKGWFFVGRGGEGNATVTFNGANLTSASDDENSGLGIHVSGREKGTDNKYDGTLVIKNSTIELDYLIDRGTITLDEGAKLTVKNGFGIAGRPASETEDSNPATATISLIKGAKLIVNNHNGMGVGQAAKDPEGYGIMNIDATSTFETTQSFLVTANGTMNNNGGNITINGTLTVNGNLNSSGNITGNITKADAATIILTGGIYTQDVNNFCHADYDAIAMGDGKWIVVQVSGTQTRELPDAGWYWFSTYITYNNEETALDNLQVALGSNASLIKGQNAFTQYLNYNGTNFWTSDLTTLSTAKMYMIKTKADNVTVNLTGSFEDYANTNIELKQGWNWIGYPINEAVSLNDAIPTEALKDGDIIKDQTSSARYYVNFELPNGNTFTGWDGSLTEMKPGQGYMFKSVNEKTFSYTTSSNGARSTLNTVDYNGDNHWFTDATQYPNNMNIVAMMSIDGEIVKGNYEVAAFANGECRGSARPIYIEALDAYVLYMTIHGEDVAELTFKYYDVNYGTEYELDNRLTYSSDAILGSLKDPYIFTMNILGIGENSIDNINIYPNPTTTDREINLQAMCDKVEVFNALGVKVAEYTNVDSIDAIETAGIYVIRVTIDGNARNCRLVVR